MQAPADHPRNTATAPRPAGERIFRIFLFAGLAAAGIQFYRSVMDLAAFRTFALTVVSLGLEALPYLILGSVAAAAVHEFVPAGSLSRIATRMGPAGIPLAALSGIVAPVCECAIVPTVGRLRAKGLSLPYAITVLVAVPLINPVVLLSTLAAFPGRRELVVARFAGGFAVAVLVGVFFWIREAFAARTATPATDDATGPSDVNASQIRPALVTPTSMRVPLRSRLHHLVGHAMEEFLAVAGYFMAGATLSALVQVLIPPEQFALLAQRPMVATLVMISLAFVLSVCSEADAFIGKAFLPLVPAPAVIAFLVFGPMMDLKNASMLQRVISRRELLELVAVLTVLVTALAAILEIVW
jgi:uncharacterized membrane protein YraQ (UPF0718 family)